MVLLSGFKGTLQEVLGSRALRSRTTPLGPSRTGVWLASLSQLCRPPGGGNQTLQGVGLQLRVWSLGHCVHLHLALSEHFYSVCIEPCSSVFQCVCVGL